ncbi:phosphatase PAP2 family protein [Candidatus Uabimicrobium amorphum]|uniref:Phosphatase PAP2 family protein n=1 Tax=Uabimicrobium amorphum TaxID=2596890 RepID=A0A5S9F4G8_UABAM|nr:phosphatase PAP2 family protein [Candidatus Uabimicrobium amorphum]BBM84579.1 phosphatase PAP2 family protein [Candidatus Uabimicrobium amorphum]
MRIWMIRVSSVLLLVYCFFSGPIDMAVAQFFYTENGFARYEFALFCRNNFHYPAQVLMFSSIALFVLSYIFKQISKYRRAMILVVACVLLAPYLSKYLVKEIWDRPRPATVKEFGGEYDFRPFYVVPIFQEKIDGSSFPSGHCVRGFCFVVLCVIGYSYKNYLLLYSGLFLTILMGGVQVFAAVSLGRHFLSDTFGAFVLTLLVTVLSHYFFIYVESKLVRFCRKET